MFKHMSKMRASALGLGAALLTFATPIAAETWSFPVRAGELRASANDPFNGTETQYEGLDASEVTKSWNICFLVPHTTNDIIRAYLYGTVKEVERLGASLTVLDAGGYGNVDKQLSQFDDCVTLGADAILLMAVSPTAFNQKIAEARSNGVKIVDLNIGVDAEVDGRVVVTYKAVGDIIGDTLAEMHPAGSDAAKVVVMPGPAGVAWSEDTQLGFAAAAKDTSVAIEQVVYGGSGRLDQQSLVEDVLITYPDLDYIVGMGTSLEAALNTLREQGRVGDVKLYGSFMTPDLVSPLKRGIVSGVVVENSIIINRLAVDMAVRLLEGKAAILDAVPNVTLVDASNVDTIDDANFAPDSWKAVMSVN